MNFRSRTLYNWAMDAMVANDSVFNPGSSFCKTGHNAPQHIRIFFNLYADPFHFVYWFLDNTPLKSNTEELKQFTNYRSLLFFNIHLGSTKYQIQKNYNFTNEKSFDLYYIMMQYVS